MEQTGRIAMKFSGSYVALVTPFQADGRVDFGKLRELVLWHLQEGTDGIVALGTTGESSTMTHEEDDEVARCIIETVNGRIPVIVGAGSNCTQTQLEKSRAYHDMGADGLLLEVHNNPACALCDGAQSLDMPSVAQVMQDVRRRVAFEGKQMG